MRKGLLRHKCFAAFTAAIGLGSIADEVARLALPLLVLDLTHSIAAAATLRVVQSIPNILFGAPAGALIDRVDKRRLLIACDIAGVALTAAIPLSAIGGVFSIELLYVIGFLLGTRRGALGRDHRLQRRPIPGGEARAHGRERDLLAADRAARIMGPTLALVAHPPHGQVVL